MDDMKEQVKGFMKKVSFSSSSSGRFKGQGRVLGSSSSGPSNPIQTRTHHNLNSKPTPTSASNSRPLPQKPIYSEQNRTEGSSKPNSNCKLKNGFDPFDPLITSSKRSQNGYSLNVYECPICGLSFRPEEEVSIHVDGCVSNEGSDGNAVSELVDNGVQSRSELEIYVGTYLSGKPSEGSVEIVLKLLKNIVREPENAKFRRIRLSNPKIKEAVGDVAGGVVAELCWFRTWGGGEETWAVKEVPKQEQIKLIKKAVELLEAQPVQEPLKKDNLASGTSKEKMDGPAEPKKVDRQV